jgi:hypothetical protein
MKATLALLTLAAAFGLQTMPAQAQDNPPAAHTMGGPGHEGGKGHFFSQADVNQDGYLTREEMEAAQQKRLDKMFTHVDGDNDGKLSQEELKKGHEEMRQKMRERFKDRGPRPEGAPQQ